MQDLKLVHQPMYLSVPTLVLNVNGTISIGSSPGTCTVTNTVVEGPPPTETLNYNQRDRYL